MSNDVTDIVVGNILLGSHTVTAAKEYKAHPGDAFRLMCPNCEAMWSTTVAPSECPDCGSIVTIRFVRRHKRS